MSINLEQVKKELGNYFRTNNKVVREWVYREAQVSKYMRTLTRVKGKFPAQHSVTDHVIQGFASVWNALGTTTFKTNELVNYHQKVNFEIVPADILNSWLAELYQENMKPADMPISKYIAEKELGPKVVEDIEILSGDGVYDNTKLGQFGYSMNGLKKILADGIANVDNPMYRIKLNALQDNNIVAEVTSFERAIPTKVRKSLKYIFMSTSNLERYILDYENKFGANTNYTAENGMKTRLGKRTIVGLDCLDGSDLIFATPEDNFLKLIDIFDAPQVTDVQTLDYKVKIFMEFWLGYGFWINQLVMVSVYTGTSTGLASGSDGTDNNQLYYA
ncbi:hypothetical protein [Xanthocytophaga agilis]|uniref:Major capsid protein n=1 Tax=Xanthocytophaga agilis TaxID=3048010 RepID=A0AAE3R331_9BACT|nr:hypothetical protein [Xanthocytophaga agilis]MDJ1500470.1 hypothetical protein [Xanthocytophaga agilis]